MIRTQLPREIELEISEQMFNEKYFPHLYTIYAYEVYYGGSGSGKSVFACQKKSLQMTFMDGRNMVCLRKQKKDCIDSLFGEIYNALRTLGLLRFWIIQKNPEHKMTCILNGNIILFEGVDDIENIKSIKFMNEIPKLGIEDDFVEEQAVGNLTDVIYEEVSEEDDIGVIRELDRRLRDPFHKCNLTVIFNPIHRTHWLKAWIEVDLRGEDALILKSTFRDNRFLDPSYRKKLEKYRYTDPYSYMVYALGEWGVTGKSVFPVRLVHARLETLVSLHEQMPPKRIEFAYSRTKENQIDLGTFTPFTSVDGETWIYREVNPKHPYVMAVDTAGEGSDFYAAHVTDNITKEQVAVFHSDKMPEWCMPQVYALGKMYNWALIAPEINFDSYPIAKLIEWKYRKIYQRETAIDNYSQGYEGKLGFRTTSANRQMMLSSTVEWATDNMHKINDVATLNEMITFTRQVKPKKGIFWSAEAGAHDDLIMALAIDLLCQEQQFCEEQPEIAELKGLWFLEELDMAVRSGRVSKRTAKQYTKKNQGADGILGNLLRDMSRMGSRRHG